MNKNKNQDTQDSAAKYQPGYRENVLTTTILFVPRKSAQLFDFLSSAPGFKTVIAPVAASYALALGVEAVYLSLPVAGEKLGIKTDDRELVMSEMRFVPKLGIDDGAELHRLLPLRQIQSQALDRAGVPDWAQGWIPKQERNVWDSPMLFLFAFGICAAVQYYERQILAPRKVSDLKAEFDQANKTKKVKADPDAIWLAQQKAAQLNSYGTGKTATDALCVGLVYSLEFAAFWTSFGKAGVSLAIALIYAAYTVFGFELFYRGNPDPNAQAAQ